MRGPVVEPSRGGPRLVRALALAGSGIAVGWLAHTGADGAVHLSPASALLLLGVLALAWMATLRPVPLPVIAGILGSGQVLTHLALSAGHGPVAPPRAVLDALAATAASPLPVSHHGHHGHHGAVLLGGAQPGVEPTASPAAGGAITLPVEPRMIAFHLLATVALTLLFTVGERALWRTIERLVPRWSLPVLPAPFRAPVPAVLGLAPTGLAHRRVRERAPPV